MQKTALKKSPRLKSHSPSSLPFPDIQRLSPHNPFPPLTVLSP